jgi:hypothetical protein
VSSSGSIFTRTIRRRLRPPGPEIAGKDAQREEVALSCAEERAGVPWEPWGRSVEGGPARDTAWGAVFLHDMFDPLHGRTRC